MARLLSVNVGMPRDIEWRGKTVRTGIWKEPVAGRRPVGKLNVEGDGQGDLAGHGGEQRAVFVYQVESYRYWERRLGRAGFSFGQFGENFTVEALGDDEVCIGDRYRIGSALFEVTQPRVTCYRVGIRMDEPQMAALLTSSNRTGFYFRVLEEGEVGADDPIVLVEKGEPCMAVAVVNALLYSKDHPRERLERALTIPALSPGWRQSFEALRRSQDADPGAAGNAGLAPGPTVPAPTPGFRSLRVAAIHRECADVVSFVLRSLDARPLRAPLAGQFVVLRVQPRADGVSLYRSYSLSGPPSDEQYRISVRIEPDGVAGRYFIGSVRANDVLDVSEPRGSFILQADPRPVVLLSAGIGATPVLAMLHALVASKSAREVWWLHGARNGETHAFADEARQLLDQLEHRRSRVWYSRPGPNDRLGSDYDESGHVDVEGVERLGVPREADFYLCGPPAFIADLDRSLKGWGVASSRIHAELFGGAPALNPGIVDAAPLAPHPPSGEAGTGPRISFARSGLTVRARSNAESILELAEACDVPVRWSCRSGVCHTCETGLVSGSVSYSPEPLDAPARGNVLICCARALDDVVLDL